MGGSRYSTGSRFLALNKSETPASNKETNIPVTNAAGIWCLSTMHLVLRPLDMADGLQGL